MGSPVRHAGVEVGSNGPLSQQDRFECFRLELAADTVEIEGAGVLRLQDPRPSW